MIVVERGSHLFWGGCYPKDRPLKRGYKDHEQVTYKIVKGLGSGMRWTICRARATQPQMRAIARAERSA
jgi:hypothetical protein